MLWQSTNVKTLLIPYVLSFLLSFLVLKQDLFTSSVIGLLISLPFENMIREWVIYSPQPGDNSAFYFSFGLTPKIIFCVLATLLLFFSKNSSKNNKIKWDYPTVLLLIFFILVTFTSVFFQTRTTPVFVGYVRIAFAVAIYLLSKVFFSIKNNNKVFVYFILALSVFSSYTGSIQLIKQRQAGKFLELTPSFSQTGYETTDGQTQFRVSGFISHPVYFGSFLSILVPMLLGIVIKYSKIRFLNQSLFYPGLALVIVMSLVLLGTLSRSVWLNIALIGVLFSLYFKHNSVSLPSFNLPKMVRKYVLPFFLIAVTIPLALLIAIRSFSLPSLFEPGGSGSVRLHLALQSLELAKIRPLVGVGLNNSVFEQLVETRLPNTIIAPPHNTYLLFLSELGVPATLIFITFIYASLRPKYNPLKLPPVTFGVWVGLLTFLISSQIHPLFNLDPTFDLFMMGLGYLSTCRQYPA